MRSISILSFSTAVGLTALSLLGAACTSEVIVDDEHGRASNDVSVADKVKPWDDQAPESDAIAILRSQLPSIGSDDGGSPDYGSSSSSGSGSSGSVSAVTTGTGGGVDPNTLYLIVGNPALTCSDPYGDYDCGSWRVSIGIPPSLQVPGTLDLSDPALISHFSVQGPDEGGASCWGGGGSFWVGQIEITSIDATSVDFKLTGTADDHFDADGEYTALRCP